MKIVYVAITVLAVVGSSLSGYLVGYSQKILTPAIIEVVEVPAVDEPFEGIVGIASWYDAKRGGQSTWYSRAGIKFYAAAGPKLRALKNFRYGMAPYAIRITNIKTGREVIAYVVDWCECPAKNRIVDLAPAVFKELGVDLSLGLQKVKIEIVR